MSKEEAIEMTDTVVNCLKGATFKVQLDNVPDKIIMCVLSGNMRRNYIKIVTGDPVTVEMSPYDLSKGRITWRNK